MNIDSLQPDSITLRFPNEDLEKAFNDSYRSNWRFFIAASGYLLAIMVALSITGVFVDFSVNRDQVQQLIWFAYVPLTVGLLISLTFAPLARYRRSAIVTYVSCIGIVAIVFPRLQDLSFLIFYGHSYLAILLLLFFPLTRIRWTPGLMLAASLIVAYAVSIGSVDGIEQSTLIMHIAILLAATVFGFSVEYLIELNVRRAFAARAVIEERERHLREETEKLAASEARLREEQEKSETLLASLLPPSIVERLKVEGKSIVDGIVECSVIFCDLVGFTVLSQELGPRALVDLLNELFSKFDQLTDKHGLEKIKTIGDAYMAAAGVPEYRADHAGAAADMALETVALMEQVRAEQDLDLQIRIGIHSGPVIAGIIGTKKFTYDLWGDAVNTASRMESHGEPDRIQVSDATYLLLRRQYELESRGLIVVKGKGPVATYWLTGRKPVLSGQA